MKCFRYLFPILLVAFSARAQLNVCNGSKGDPIFVEDFGSGTGFGPALPAGTTTYSYIAGTPEDGSYTISPTFNLNGAWHNTQDHTPGDINGRALIVNADFTPGEFYRREVTGLCVNTTFELSAWIINLYNTTNGPCGGTGIPVDVTFEIWDQTGTNLIASGTTGEIEGTGTPLWNQFGLSFTPLPGETSVILKIRNNGAGGCGNDLAIDDIAFRSCGDPANITGALTGQPSQSVCAQDVPVSVPLQLNILGSNHAIQWQSSPDGQSWSDLPGVTTTSYTTAMLYATTYFRARIAQDAANLNNPYCSTVSDIFALNIIPQPAAPQSGGDVTVCDGDPVPPLSATVPAGVGINWFDAPTGGNLVSSGATYQTDVPGTYYAEAFSQDGHCSSAARTPVTLVFAPIPVVSDGSESFCEGQSATLTAGIANATYLWSTGETAPAIEVSVGGNYSVTVTNAAGCSAVRHIAVTEYPLPVISGITIDQATVSVETATAGDFLFSLDGSAAQASPVFNNVRGGQHSVTVTEIHGCNPASQDFLLLVFPRFFTPNGDGSHESFRIEGLENVPGAETFIFDRFGKLLKELRGDASWDGTFNGRQLPADDYWYRLQTADGKIFRGHFALHR